MPLFAAIILTACLGACSPVPPPSVEPDPSAPGLSPDALDQVPADRLTRFDSASLSEDRLVLTLDFIGGPEYAPDDPCSSAYAGWAKATGEILEAAVVDVTPPHIGLDGGTNVLCTAMGYFRTVSVRLAEPFHGVRVHDRAGYVHFVGRPGGLVEIHGLPDGWVLRSERSVEESPTGRYQRTYAPVPEPAAGTSLGRLDVFQSFGGPVSVTGGEEMRVVKVNGTSATLYRQAEAGELVLVWTLGSDGLALVANEADFTAGALVRLAESATAP